MILHGKLVRSCWGLVLGLIRVLYYNSISNLTHSLSFDFEAWHQNVIMKKRIMDGHFSQNADGSDGHASKFFKECDFLKIMIFAKNWQQN